MKNVKNSTTDCAKNKSQNQQTTSSSSDCFHNSTKSSKKRSRTQESNCAKNVQGGDFYQ